MKVFLVVIGACCLGLGVYLLGMDAYGFFVQLDYQTSVATGIMATAIGAIAIDRGLQQS